ncbi:MAG: plasmid pRiA4b ORF-3 family protein [Ketobacter sp.]|nr:plasmid pRiA4b ORF-3 family protein [Ketobacter sp.]
MNIYTVKIALRGISPMIMRRLRLAGHTTIADLHHVIQRSMGWDDEYLHRFHIYGKDYGIAYEGGISFSDDPRIVYLDDFNFDPGDRFTYTYNFFDDWLCDVRVEQIEIVDGDT